MTVYVSVLRLTDTNMNHMTQFCLSLSCFRPLELSKCAFCNSYDSPITRRNFNKLLIFVDFRFVIHLLSVNRQGISSTELSSLHTHQLFLLCWISGACPLTSHPSLFVQRPEQRFTTYVSASAFFRHVTLISSSLLRNPRLHLPFRSLAYGTSVAIFQAKRRC